MKSRTTKIMMIVFLFISMLAINGCDIKKIEGDKSNTRVIEIDGCEYIQQHTTKGWEHTIHKENCKNPIHKINKYEEQLPTFKSYKMPELKQWNKENK